MSKAWVGPIPSRKNQKSVVFEAHRSSALPEEVCNAAIVDGHGAMVLDNAQIEASIDHPHNELELGVLPVDELIP